MGIYVTKQEFSCAPEMKNRKQYLNIAFENVVCKSCPHLNVLSWFAVSSSFHDYRLYIWQLPPNIKRALQLKFLSYCPWRVLFKCVVVFTYMGVSSAIAFKLIAQESYLL